jgi:hypothetical protein
LIAPSSSLGTRGGGFDFFSIFGGSETMGKFSRFIIADELMHKIVEDRFFDPVKDICTIREDGEVYFSCWFDSEEEFGKYKAIGESVPPWIRGCRNLIELEVMVLKLNTLAIRLEETGQLSTFWTKLKALKLKKIG